MEKEFTRSLTAQFDGYLDQLSEEIQLFDDPSKLWSVQGAISNSPGNLCLHLIGNLNHFIGHQLGGNDYVRDRPAEFNDKNVNIDSILKQIEETKSMVADVLESLDSKKLTEKFPLKNHDYTNLFFLMHLLKHFAYHLGQINYYRRVLDR